MFALPARHEKAWITLKELFAWSRLVGLIIVDEDLKEVSRFSNRVKALIERNGYSMTFRYLKECFRIVVHLSAGKPAVPDYSGIRVKVDSSGYPKILPSRWRLMAQQDVR